MWVEFLERTGSVDKMRNERENVVKKKRKTISNSEERKSLATIATVSEKERDMVAKQGVVV